MSKLPREAQIERERQIWALRQKLYTQERIAAEIGVDQSTVSRILRKQSDRYLVEINEEVGRVKAQQIAQLEYVAQEAIEAWERSKDPAKKLNKRAKALRARGQDGDDRNAVAEEVTTVETADQDGDPRYLTTAMSALGDIRKILGADAPARTTAATTSTVHVEESLDLSKLSADQLRELVRITESLQASPGAGG
jgi:hypothetical protein